MAATRPTQHDDEILLAAMGPLLKVLQAEDDQEQAREICRIYSNNHFDGHYAVARELDLRGWSVDDEVLEAVEAIEWQLYSKLDEAVRHWVASNAIKPKLAVGSAVQVERKGKIHDGIVARIEEGRGQYVVRIPAEGHVESGDGTHGWCIDFEELHDIVNPPEEFELVAPLAG